MLKQFLVLFIFLTATATYAAEVDLDNYYSSARIAYKGDQWYQQDFTKENISYMADIVTRQCYFLDRRWNAVLSIDCENLMRRKEWEKVLVWLKAK